MADLEQTALLVFDIDEAPAVNSIRDLRSANTQLRKERDAVNISTKEGQELVAKLNTTIDKNNKLIKDNSSALEKQRQNVGNYSKSIEEAAGNLNIMGTNVGALTSKLSSFVNPATAVVGVVTALGAAYASSTIGAKDLTFASNQLGAATGILANNFASLISSAEDGEGAISRVTNFLIAAVGGVGLSAQSKGIALAQEAIDDLQREEIRVRGVVNDRLADNQELLTQIQDSQTSYNDKLNLTTQIISNISANEDDLLTVKKQQLASAQRILNADSENEDKQRSVLEIEREISNISKDAERRRQAIFRTESNITDERNKQLAAAERQAQIENQSERDRVSTLQESRRLESTRSGAIGSLVTLGSPDVQKLQLAKKTESQIQDELIATSRLKRELEQEDLQAQSMYFEAAATIAATAFGEGSALYKTLAIGQATIDTYRAATAALAPPPTGAGPLFGPALAAVTIATGLANVARISGIAAAGGTDFVTNKPTLLLVGDNPGARERVTVEPLSGKGKTRSFGAGVAMAGGGSMTFNPSASDGGFVANQNLQSTNQALLMANAFKNLPPPVVSVAEINDVQSAIRVKESVSKL